MVEVMRVLDLGSGGRGLTLQGKGGGIQRTGEWGAYLIIIFKLSKISK